MHRRTPFGNPDGSRSDIHEVVESFVSFEEFQHATEMGIRPDELSARVIVGAKGSGKTVYLRRLRAAAAANDSIFAGAVQQDLPVTSNIVKFCQCFPQRHLTEKWMQLWYCAITRSMVSHLLHAPSLRTHLSEVHRTELEDYPKELLPGFRREVSVYSQVTDIINRYHTDHAFSTFFDNPAWAELATTISDILTSMPPIYFFIDSVDEEYASAPMFWLQCQKGLFFRTMRFLRDQHFGGRLHVIVCVRDHVLASVLRSEHQNRYRGEPHIVTLGWDLATAEYFLHQKIARLEEHHLIRSPEQGVPTIHDWLGHVTIENKARELSEPLTQYLLRHTRLLPRDIVILGNMLCEQVLVARRNGQDRVPERVIRRCVGQVSTSFGSEQLAICANQIASSSMPPDAARLDYDDIYTGDSEYSRGIVDHLVEVVRLIGKDRFSPEDVELAAMHGRELFGEGSDALSVLWQNRLLGYEEPSADGAVEIFFSETSCDHFNLPLGQAEYLFHSCMIDSTGIDPIGVPVGAFPPEEEHRRVLPETDTVPPPGRVPRRGNGRDQGGEYTRIGTYPVLGVLGRGGMGVVYLAEDVQLHRRIAIKVLPEGVAEDVDRLTRFRREARLLAALNHPNIATVYSLEEEMDVHFLTMEFVVGETLAEQIRSGPLAVDTTLEISLQIARALRAAHRKGVVHRDLKPPNIMVTPDRMVKVLDFGVGKVLEGESGATSIIHDPPTSSGAILGTPGYMSPEQLRGQPVDHRSDIWAFGCAVYECLSGQCVFPGKTPTERIAATMELEPDWTALPPGTPGQVIELLQSCLTKKASERLDDVSAALEALAAR